jgi:hypothetical protein
MRASCIGSPPCERPIRNLKRLNLGVLADDGIGELEFGRSMCGILVIAAPQASPIEPPVWDIPALPNSIQRGSASR